MLIQPKYYLGLKYIVLDDTPYPSILTYSLVPEGAVVVTSPAVVERYIC